MMKKFVFICLMMCIMVPGFVIAQGQAGGSNTNTGVGGSAGGGNGNTGVSNPNIIRPVITNPLRIGNDIPTIIEAVMRGIVMPIAAVLVVLAILYSGFKFVMAQGNSTELQKAREGLVWVLVGSVVLLGAYGIAEVLKTTINQVVGTSV